MKLGFLSFNTDFLGNFGKIHTILWLLFFVAIFAFMSVSSMLFYHWYSYGMRNPLIRLMGALYFAGGAVILAGILVTISFI